MGGVGGGGVLFAPDQPPTEYWQCQQIVSRYRIPQSRSTWGFFETILIATNIDYGLLQQLDLRHRLCQSIGA